MACATCSTTSNGTPAGCGSKGNCLTGGCNKKNVYNWFADIPISFSDGFNIVEISFKKGSRKSFYRNDKYLQLSTGDLVVVDAQQGFDMGEVSLQGELVRLQMKKTKTKDNREIPSIRKIAGEKDIQILKDSRKKEKNFMVTARVIARELKLDMKIGDVEFQADGKKATFYYTAEGRVDFRELVKRYAKEFKIKIEMRQIGSRQEAGRIGGIGSCGRELCCSTWLSDFKSVTTSAARYQNLAINTDKLSGQCGRLKCCLNYELDTYMDALSAFPKKADFLKTKEGGLSLRKTDIFRKLMYFENQETRKIHKLELQEVKNILALNKKGEMPAAIKEFEDEVIDQQIEEYEDLVGHVSLKALEKKSNKSKNRNKRRRGRNNNRKKK
ncbi:MAG: Signal peptidase-like protein [Chitinophagales bacterium]|nr:Signal peptidase-like protein [Chitinophagales bacterium]